MGVSQGTLCLHKFVSNLCDRFREEIEDLQLVKKATATEQALSELVKRLDEAHADQYWIHQLEH